MSWRRRWQRREEPLPAGLSNEQLATEDQFFALESRILTALADQSHNGDHGLRCQEQHPEGHTSVEACALPKAGFL